jgi:cytochrome c biogenesis DsbD-like protein
MLPAMSRWALLVVLAACSSSNSNDKQDKPKPVGPAEKIAVPGPDEKTVTPQPIADNPQFHLKPEEGSLTTKCEAKPGALTASLEVQPGTGYHISQDYPIKLTIEAPAGVKIDKTELTAGGRDKSQGDAQQLTEQHLAFAVNAKPDKPGNYELKGTFKFGVCDKDSCHPKKQPVAIQCAAI